ncbi:DNA translocase FtsK [Brevibacillus choshinensis]|uniref:DNA translocase FtsK n=2 Tax=Brevibacillus choshinensis TaxID=54911 RepID=A0ABX7FY43_BRECH|nr:DNA translocase FtsK [Brevibacillus choshinensis]
MWSWLQKLMSFFQGEEEQRIDNDVRPPVQSAPRQLQAKTKSIYPKERAYTRSGDEFRQEKERHFRFPVVPDEYPERKRKEKQADDAVSVRERQQGTARDTGSTVRESSPATFTGRNIETPRKQQKPQAVPDKPIERAVRPTEPRAEQPVRPRQAEDAKKVYKPSEIVSPVYGKITSSTREEEHRIHTTSGIVYPRLEQEEHLNQLKQWEQQRNLEKEGGITAGAPAMEEIVPAAVEPKAAVSLPVEEPAAIVEDEVAAASESFVHHEAPVLSDEKQEQRDGASEQDEFGWSAIGRGLKQEAATAHAEVGNDTKQPLAMGLESSTESLALGDGNTPAESCDQAEAPDMAEEVEAEGTKIEGMEEPVGEEAGPETAHESAHESVQEPAEIQEPKTALESAAERELVEVSEEESAQEQSSIPGPESVQEHSAPEPDSEQEAVIATGDTHDPLPSPVISSFTEEEAVQYQVDGDEPSEREESNIHTEEPLSAAEEPPAVAEDLDDLTAESPAANVSQGASDAVEEAAYKPALTRLLERAEADMPKVQELDLPIRQPLAPEPAAAATPSANDPAEPVIPAKEEEPAYSLPQLDLLNPSPIPSDDDDEHTQLQKLLLEETLSNFNVSAQVVGIVKGPSVTRFELQPAPGVKVNKITGLVDDIKLNLAAKDIRIEAPIPGRNAIGIEVPNLSSRPVMISTIIGSDKFQEHSSPLAVALGMDIGGEPIVADIKKMPHGLIAGSTGSGKSVCINSIIVSLLYKATPEQVRLLLIDPKMVELAPYNHLPHLVTPVVTEAKQATAALKWAVEEMEKRYALFVDAGVRDIDRYNQTTDDTLPYIVIVIDELADLMMVSPQDVEDCIIRIAQKARACGIHLLLATQRPSVDVITGNIKANVPTRLAFAVFSQVDSRTILDQSGAERLLGRGDMLFLESGTTPVRLQGNFVSDDEIERITQVIKKQRKPSYIFSKEDLEQQVQSFDAGDDPLYLEALVFVAEQGQASASGLQRRFRVGYNRAARLIEMMEADGYVAGQSGGKARAVLITREDAQAVVEGSTLV